MKRSAPIRRTAVRKKRPGPPRNGRLAGKDLEDLRDQCFERDGGVCVNCGRTVDKHADQILDWSYHMAHIRAKRIGGDVLSNIQTECGSCHRAFHLGGPSREKVCPAKPKPDAQA